MRTAVQSFRYQGWREGKGVVGSLFVFQKPSNTWLVFIRLRPRPRPPPQQFWFPNNLREETRPGSFVHCVNQPILTLTFYTRGDNQYYPLSFLWSPRFPSKMAVTRSQLGCWMAWWQCFCLPIKHQPHDLRKFFIIEKTFSQYDCLLTGRSTNKWSEIFSGSAA